LSFAMSVASTESPICLGAREAPAVASLFSDELWIVLRATRANAKEIEKPQSAYEDGTHRKKGSRFLKKSG
jgi:hypothetical protein